MILLIPLAIFLVLCLVMVGTMVHTRPPSAIDTVEALCDAVIRHDIVTQRTLMSMNAISTTVAHAIGTLCDDHDETAMSYNAQVVEQWDDANSSYALVSVPLPTDNEHVRFTCQYTVNQWTIIAMQIDSPKIHLDS